MRRPWRMRDGADRSPEISGLLTAHHTSSCAGVAIAGLANLAARHARGVSPLIPPQDTRDAEFEYSGWRGNRERRDAHSPASPGEIAECGWIRAAAAVRRPPAHTGRRSRRVPAHVLPPTRRRLVPSTAPLCSLAGSARSTRCSPLALTRARTARRAARHTRSG